MEHIYKFSNDNYISEYDYDLCEKDSDDEYSDEENSFHEEVKDGDEGGTTNSGGSRPSNLSLNNKGKLPKSINTILDGFSMKMAKTKSFH